MRTNDEVSVGIGNIDTKVRMLQATFETCIDKYHEPIAFMAQVDATIQAIRNFTFTLQNNKSEIKNFDDWYHPWTERLNRDPYLRWLCKTRTGVVHNDVLSTTSNAQVDIIIDHAHRLKTKHFEIMATTEGIIDYGVRLADRQPHLKHAVGTIYRHYMFNVDGEELEAIAVLGAGFAAMRMVYEDLAAYLGGEAIIKSDLPNLVGIYSDAPEKLKVVFKLRDGSILTEHNKTLTRRQLVENTHLAIKRYGLVDAGFDIKSKDKAAVLRGYFEVARTVFSKDNHHTPMMLVKSKDGSARMINPAYRDRAEKMLFMERLAEIVKRENIIEIIFITESWTHSDVNRVSKHLDRGKEFKSLRSKGEALSAIYLDSDGVILEITAPIQRDRKSGVVELGEVSERSLTTDEYQIFNPVYCVWGLVDKVVVKD